MLSRIIIPNQKRNTSWVFTHDMSKEKWLGYPGSAWDVAMDLWKGSLWTLGGCVLSAENNKMFYVPEGFVHGFITIEDEIEFVYKCVPKGQWVHDSHNRCQRAVGAGFLEIFLQLGISIIATDYIMVNHCYVLDITNKAAMVSFLAGKSN